MEALCAVRAACIDSQTERTTYDLVETIKSNPNFLTPGDESCCVAYDLETKQQSSKWCGPTRRLLKNFNFINQG